MTSAQPKNRELQNKQENKSGDTDSKRLLDLKDEIIRTKVDIISQGKQLDDSLERIAQWREEVEKSLAKEVQWLHSLLDLVQHRKLKPLRQIHTQVLEQALVAKTQGKNSEAKFADLYMDVDECLSRLSHPENKSSAVKNEISTLIDRFSRLQKDKPSMKVPHISCRIDTPEVTSEDLEKLLGSVIITDDTHMSGKYEGENSCNGGAKSKTLQDTMDSFFEKVPAKSATNMKGTANSNFTKSESKGNTLNTGLKPTDKKQKNKSQESLPTTKKRVVVPSKKKNEEVQNLTKPEDSMSILTVTPGSNREFFTRDKEVSALVETYNGDVWAVYGHNDPHLDIMDADGQEIKSKRIGGNAMFLTCFNIESVLVTCISPRSLKVMKNLEDSEPAWKHTLEYTPVGAGVGNSGIAVASYKSLQWLSLDGKENFWIVPEKDTKPKMYTSCDVVILKDAETVCVSDRENQKVLFFQKCVSPKVKFNHMPSFVYSLSGTKAKGKPGAPFIPICVSAHPAGMLAILEEAQRSVIMVDIAKNCAISVIPKEVLCRGVPTLVAFGVSEETADDHAVACTALWVGSDRRWIFKVPITFKHNSQ